MKYNGVIRIVLKPVSCHSRKMHEDMASINSLQEIMCIILTAWFWFGLISWHINYGRLFNTKSFLHIYIKYMISKHIL